jgi:dihydrofolate synthase/folylpolyglutamate synthase
VGLGGRLDATNVLRPVVTVIPDISLDHTEILGPTLADIAREKAGIVKRGIPLVIGLLPAEARRVTAAVCHDLGAPLVSLTRKDFRVDQDDLSLDFMSPDLRISNLVPSLKGPHQIRNAAVVLKTAEVIRRQGISLPLKAVKTGIEHTDWPGRFQIVRKTRSSPTVVLDVCHNPGGAEAFVDTFCRVFPGRRAHVLLGFVKRKAHQEMIDHFAKIASDFRLTRLPTNRGVDPGELVTTLNWRKVPVIKCAWFETAYRRLLKRTGPDDIIAVVGSHYLVGEYLSKYGRV